MKIKITEAQLKNLKSHLINEVSADKIMGAAKKMWQEKISGNDYNENPRAKKLLNDYGNKLKGLQIFNSEVSFVDANLLSNNGPSFSLMFLIAFKNNATFTVGNGSYTGIYYNFTTDQFMVGAQLHGDLRNLNEFSETTITKYDARQLYKIAKHFNDNTRYVNYTREIPINVNL